VFQELSTSGSRKVSARVERWCQIFLLCRAMGGKKLVGKDLVVLSINLSQALNVINMLQNIKIKSKNKNMFFQRAAILGNYRRYSQDFLQFIHVMEQWFMRESKITQAHCEM